MAFRFNVTDNSEECEESSTSTIFYECRSNSEDSLSSDKEEVYKDVADFDEAVKRKLENLKKAKSRKKIIEENKNNPEKCNNPNKTVRKKKEQPINMSDIFLPRDQLKNRIADSKYEAEAKQLVLETKNKKEPPIDIKGFKPLENILGENPTENIDSISKSIDLANKNDRSRIINRIALYFIEVSSTQPIKDKIIRIETRNEKLEFNLANDAKIPFIIKKSLYQEIHYKIFRKGYFTKTRIFEFLGITVLTEFQVSDINFKIYLDSEMEFNGIFKNEILTPVEYTKLLLARYKKPKGFFGKLLNFISINGLFWSKKGDIFVKDLKTEEIHQEKVPKTLKLYFMFFFSERLSNMAIYRYFLKRMTLLSAKRFDSEKSRSLIIKFVKFYDINLNEIKLDIRKFKNFNEFFSRELKSNARWIEDMDGISSPADSRIVAFKYIKDVGHFWIKGKKFSVETFLNKRKVKIESMLVCRLAPQDYHRFHSPCDGRIEDISYNCGQYLTVHPESVKRCDALTENLRVVIVIKTKKRGYVYCVAVGATLVGSITLSVEIGQKVRHLDELGYFKFGGSTVCLLFSRPVLFHKNVLNNTYIGIETVVKVGNCIGKYKE
ncbi:phosphatidylserine decarboxylase [Hamiltosporidium tvaerminnensis]|uniref:Phosphatidylserine decarboxylase n=1 Tax=Hamiltosporidium tvaerminnensis TaxID=1176355 RepID=A0A4Q9KZK8_9MICR|nr:phosphatidylserine decarboxylase [Hamiltosporidium tvaerminnensis]TBU00478.1 phosphatidylserine decarboxylase [Hamiltosporidium tvaerminnensis]